MAKGDYKKLVLEINYIPEIENILGNGLSQRDRDRLNKLTFQQLDMVKRLIEEAFFVGRQAESEEYVDRCEGCQKPAKYKDSEGTPLCADCYIALLQDTPLYTSAPEMLEVK